MNIPQFADYFMQILPRIASGALVSIQIFAITLICSIPLGLILSILATSKIKVVKAVVWFYTWVLRGTPLLLQMFFVYFALPNLPLFGINIVLDRLPAVITAFVLNYAAYFSEIFRGGIESIDKGQHEACKALGFTKLQKMRRIIIPQTIKRVLAPLSNETITLIKDTSLAASLSVAELLKETKDIVSNTSNATAYAVAALLYLALTFVITLVFKGLEKRYAYYDKKD